MLALCVRIKIADQKQGGVLLGAGKYPVQKGTQKPGEHPGDSGVLHQPPRARPQAQAPRHGQGKLYPGLCAADRGRRQRAAVAQNQRTENAYQNDARPYPAHDHGHFSPFPYVRLRQTLRPPAFADCIRDALTHGMRIRNGKEWKCFDKNFSLL